MSMLFLGTITIIALLLCSCSKDDPGNSSEPNATVTIQNVGDGNGDLTNNYQFTSLSLTPTDNSSPKVTFTFVASVGQTTTVEIKIPKTGSYKIELFANDTSKYIWWNSIAMEIGGNTSIYLICLNDTYIGQSTCAGVNPDGSTL